MTPVISAEQAASMVCRLAETDESVPRPGTDFDAPLDGWRERYAQRPGPDRASHLWDCACPSPDRGNPSTSLWLELVESCNLDCVFCYNPWRPPGSPQRDQPTLTAPQLMESLDRIFSRLTVSHVTLSGGEPLLYPRLGELTARMKRHCDSIGLTTNGRSLTRRRLSALTAAGVNHVSVPVHSHVAATHDELAGAKSWRAAVRGLALSVESGVSTNMTCVLTRRNADDAPALAGLALRLGVATIVANCFHPTGQGADRSDLELSHGEFEAVLATLRTCVGDRAEIVVGSPWPGTQKKQRTGIERITVSPFGDLKLCNESSSGVVNILREPGELDGFLDAVSRNDYESYLSRVDGCACY